MINVPNQLIFPLYDSLFKDIEWINKEKPQHVVHNNYKFQYFFIIAKLYDELNLEPNNNSHKIMMMMMIFLII